MCKTKIVATLGPASQSPEMISKLINAGVNVVRLNFSHGTAEEHIERANMVRLLAADMNKHVGVLVDLQGPKIRISSFKNNAIHLTQGDTFYLDAKLDATAGDKERVGLDFPELIQDLEVGDTLLLDDGRIQLKVIQVNKEEQWAKTKALNQGKLSNRKGINLLGGGLSAPALTEKDKQDIVTASKIKADFVAVSFPRNGADIEHARALLHKAGSDAQIVAKVERAEVVESQANMDDVINASDIVMVARGDLGVEIGDARLPIVQKQLISRARFLGKPVITATQMMESMIENPLPTRAEVLDVANAIIDGTDAIMLSAESAAGNYPVEAVEAMVRIAKGAEEEQTCAQGCWDQLQHLCSDAGKSFALSSMISATKVHQDLGVAILTQLGETPLLMSRCRSNAVIWALSDNTTILNRLTILRGVIPKYFSASPYKDEALAKQVTGALQDEAEKENIQSILMTQLESMEGVGSINVCWLIDVPSEKLVAA